MSRDRVVPPSTTLGARRSALPAALPAGLLAGLLALAGCAGGEDGDAGPRDTFAAVSSAESEPPEGAEEDAEQGDDAQDATADAGQTPADGVDGPAPFTEDEMTTLLLEEDEFPFTADSFVEETGAEYFQEHIGVVSDTYVQGFGDDDCARQMDAINERLVGDEPQEGVIRQVVRHEDAGEERIYLWMLSFEDPVDSAEIWDEVLEACDGQRLADGADTIDFAAFAAEEFHGLTMEMGVDSSPETVEMEGFSATRDLGSNLLMISAVNIEADTFAEVIDAQSAKIDERLSAG